MIVYNKKTWRLCPCLVKYTQYGERLESYAFDKQWWIDFSEKWEHTTIDEIVGITHTDEQISRYNQIRDMPEDFGSVYSEYVKTGEFNVDGIPTTHKFNMLRLETEAMVLGISVSEREINEIMLGLQVSDLEIRLMEGGL